MYIYLLTYLLIVGLGAYSGALASATPLVGVKFFVLIFYVKKMLKFEHF